MKVLRKMAIVLALACVGSSHDQILGQKSAARPFLTRDLINDATFLERSKGELAVAAPLELEFLDDSTLILSYDNRTNFEEDPMLQNTFTVLLISADTGRTLSRLQQDAVPGSSAARPTASGGFVMLSGTTLRLYSRDFQVEKEQVATAPIYSNVLITPGDFKHLRCIYNKQRLDVSPDRKRLLIRSDQMVGSHGTAAQYKWTWFDASSLNQTAQWTAVGNSDFHAGKDEFIADGGRERPRLVTEQATRPLCSECWRAEFVGQNLRLESSDKSLELKNPDGSLLYRATLNELTDEFASSEDSSLFVYVTISSGISVLPPMGSPKLHFKMHVCDWKEQREGCDL